MVFIHGAGLLMETYNRPQLVVVQGPLDTHYHSILFYAHFYMAYLTWTDSEPLNIGLSHTHYVMY
jgi:hypothetical protein